VSAKEEGIDLSGVELVEVVPTAPGEGSCQFHEGNLSDDGRGLVYPCDGETIYRVSLLSQRGGPQQTLFVFRACLFALEAFTKQMMACLRASRER
jgi:hypothetical protein